ncbi:MAG: tyrosine-type recombinase/integrase [Faecalibacterium sp.]
MNAIEKMQIAQSMQSTQSAELTQMELSFSAPTPQGAREVNVILSCPMGWDSNGRRIPALEKVMPVPAKWVAQPDGNNADTAPNATENPTQPQTKAEQRATKIATHLEYQAWLQAQTEQFHAEVAARKTQPITIESFAQRWYASVEKFAQPRKEIDLAYILRALGRSHLQSLTPQVIRKFYATLAAETDLAFTTREGIHGTLSSICGYAVAHGYLVQNPCYHTFSYQEKPQKQPLLTDAEVIKFLACLSAEQPKHRLFFTLLLGSGLNRAECLALRWSDIHWKRRTLVARQRVVTTRAGEWMLRDIPPICVRLSQPTTDRLAEYFETQTAKIEDGFIFAQACGAPMCPSSFTYRARLLRQKHGLTGLTIERLYHYHHALRKKMSLGRLQKKLGV